MSIIGRAPPMTDAVSECAAGMFGPRCALTSDLAAASQGSLKCPSMGSRQARKRAREAFQPGAAYRPAARRATGPADTIQRAR